MKNRRSAWLWELQQAERRAMYLYARNKLGLARRPNSYVVMRRSAETNREIKSYLDKHFNERLPLD